MPIGNMDKAEFELLRDLAGKTISGDITFVADSHTSPSLIFGNIPVENSLDIDLLLNGRYNPEVGTLVFNFVAKLVGPICRVCVNGSVHKDAGRTHKHSLRKDRDPASNLPFAIARPDLAAKSPKEVWEILCVEAHITHSGTFTSPS